MKLSTALSVSATALATAAIGYAFYFDYKRRNDPAFRKKLRKQSKQSVKAAKKEMKAAAQQETMMIEKAVKDVAEPGVLPTGVQEKEAFFMEQVATGEALFAQGPTYHVPAAIAFFKALKVYPAPVELVMIYQKAVPKEVFDLIMKLITRDAAVHGAGGASAQAPAQDQDDVDDALPTSEAPAEEADKPEETPQDESTAPQVAEAPQDSQA
ncbi:mitochondrial import receptor subunit tom20 [Malassezia nana]|uniref:Mitochondrial import receptor subunit TOM20 n=1 Tax=Malassezia nana TaxID=180528 RepID=A0AAF0EUM8_9BASI|nr:mitochondrial import receptor subunit tom20 [Malassezia nana]